MKIKYFDNAATTQVNQDVIKEMLPYFSIEYGNPSSLYSIGRRAKRALFWFHTGNPQWLLQTGFIKWKTVI